MAEPLRRWLAVAAGLLHDAARRVMPPRRRRRPDRRLAPRPLPAHLASAMLLWLSSRAALTSWPERVAALERPGKPEPAEPMDRRLAALAGDVERLGPEAVAAALDRELRRRADGVSRRARRLSPPSLPPRRAARAGALARGAARLLDYGAPRWNGAGPAVLIVPSLINRYTILDLLRERSFARHLAAAGLRPLVLDWGEPGAAERDFTLERLHRRAARRGRRRRRGLAGGPVAVCGYCMGGLLALALALRRPADVACLALLATPWDFHAERRDPGAAPRRAGRIVCRCFGGGSAPLPVSVIQSLFAGARPVSGGAQIHPLRRARSGRRRGEELRRARGLDQRRRAAGAPVALECAHSWYRDNDPARGAWHVAGQPVRPEEVDGADPRRAAEPRPHRAAALGRAARRRDPRRERAAAALRPYRDDGLGRRRRQAVWQPIAEWLKAQFA